MHTNIHNSVNKLAKPRSHCLGAYYILNNPLEPRKASEYSQKDCPAASNIEYFEAKRSRQHLADLYRIVEGIWDTILRIAPAHGYLACLDKVCQAAYRTEVGHCKCETSGWPRCASLIQSVGAMESHNQIGGNAKVHGASVSHFRCQ